MEQCRCLVLGHERGEGKRPAPYTEKAPCKAQGSKGASKWFICLTAMLLGLFPLTRWTSPFSQEQDFFKSGLSSRETRKLLFEGLPGVIAEPCCTQFSFRKVLLSCWNKPFFRIALLGVLWPGSACCPQPLWGLPVPPAARAQPRAPCLYIPAPPACPPKQHKAEKKNNQGRLLPHKPRTHSQMAWGEHPHGHAGHTRIGYFIPLCTYSEAISSFNCIKTRIMKKHA